MNSFGKSLKKIIKAPLTWPLNWSPIRNRVAFEIKHHHFDALDLIIPLSHGFGVPIHKLDGLFSFEEIFVSREYGDFLEKMPFPKRWLDIGCHAGYFSLYLVWQMARRGLQSNFSGLLLDADPRMENAITRTREVNRLQSELKFSLGVIAAGSGTVTFALRGGMGSSTCDPATKDGDKITVPIFTADMITRQLPPPYDLIKIDAEGGEVDFLNHYQTVYQHAQWILLEWHSADFEGSQAITINATLQKHGFELISIIKPSLKVNGEGPFHSVGINLYHRKV